MKKYFVLGMIISLAIACRPDPYKEIGESYSVITGLQGDWTLAKVEIEDRSFPQWETMEVSDYFLNGNAVEINFDAGSTSYAISANSLDGLPFASLNGVYAFDDPEFPSNMYLISTGTDTTKVELGSMVREIDQLMLFQEMKSSCDQVYARYIYTFNRK
jgi:hypothetical protein